MILLADLLLAGGVVTFAALSLSLKDGFAGIVVFISNGLLLALCWARLGAPDVAMAEAAIGAGLTGALLLAALRRLQAADATRDGGARGTDGGS